MADETRRAFVQKVVAAAGLGAVAPKKEAWAQAPRTVTPPGAGLPVRRLGRTGVDVSILCLGGWHIGSIKDKGEAIRLMHAAVDEGLTFFDNAWDYHMGGSEEVMGEALAQDGKRKKVFLMTKNCERDYAGSMKNLEESLRRLRTDHLDLWQFHEMVYDNDPDWVFEKGGIKAALEARKAGKVRFIGFTGHKDPSIHLKMIGQPHPWDACQMPINVMDAHYRSFRKQVVPVCQKKKIGVIGMKSLGGGNGILVRRGGLEAEPLVRYALSQPISSLCIGLTSQDDLRRAVAIARDFQPMSAPEQRKLEAQVREVAGDGRFELFKSSKDFDGPWHRRQHGFPT